VSDSAVDDITICVDCAEIAVDGHVLGLQLKPDAYRLQHTPDDDIAQRIVTET